MKIRLKHLLIHKNKSAVMYPTNSFAHSPGVNSHNRCSCLFIINTARLTWPTGKPSGKNCTKKTAQIVRKLLSLSALKTRALFPGRIQHMARRNIQHSALP